MEKDKLTNAAIESWNQVGYGMEISTAEQMTNCFFNPNCENSVDQSDPFESALSSIVSYPLLLHYTIEFPSKLNLSIMDHQIRGNLHVPGTLLPTNNPNFFSCFGSSNFGKFGLNELDLPYLSSPMLKSGKLSRVSSNKSLGGGIGSQLGVVEIKGMEPHLRSNSVSDRNMNMVSRSSTPENGDSPQGSSVSEQIPGGKLT
ncbi:hypothetical protein RJ641_021675 [Dillenia turbinata]|uniref:Uncharacterized protein n=1 Tax=Dillenia turbinata TaxID=194707 RepID=A0AAN8YT66_9MAGN